MIQTKETLIWTVIIIYTDKGNTNLNCYNYILCQICTKFSLLNCLVNAWEKTSPKQMNPNAEADKKFILDWFNLLYYQYWTYWTSNTMWLEFRICWNFSGLFILNILCSFEPIEHRFHQLLLTNTELLILIFITTFRTMPCVSYARRASTSVETRPGTSFARSPPTCAKAYYHNKQ